MDANQERNGLDIPQGRDTRDGSFMVRVACLPGRDSDADSMAQWRGILVLSKITGITELPNPNEGN